MLEVQKGISGDIEEIQQRIRNYGINKSYSIAESAVSHTELLKHLQTCTIKLFDGFISQICKISNTKIAIISSNHTEIIKKSLVNSGLNPDIILGYQDCFSKVERYRAVLDYWNILPNQTYFFTDTLTDILDLETILPMENIIGCAWGYLGSELLHTKLPIIQILVDFDYIHQVFQANNLK